MTATDAPKNTKLAAPAKAPNPEADLRAAIAKLEQENKSLSGQLSTATPELLAELKAKNQELKTQLLQIEKDLAIELLHRKYPLDAPGITDQFEILKSGILAYCTEKKIDPALWKKLESL